MNPEVSVLMSCYNAGRWLHEAIDSVMAQTFKDFELILVDDGSSDETRAIIGSYCDRDRRIVPIFKGNTGLADSLNVGIAQARGGWIARLDADDLCEPTRIEEQLKFVSTRPDVVLLGTGCFEMDNQGRVMKKHLYPSDHDNLVRHLERLRPFFPHSSAFYRADDVRRVGGYIKHFRRSQDWRLWLELTSRGRIACLPRLLVRIRRHPDQVSLDNAGRRQLCYGIAGTVCHLLRKAGHQDPSIDAGGDEWIAFLEWIEQRIEDQGIFERRESWYNARAEYFTAENKLNGMLRFGIRLLQSGYIRSQAWERLFGSSLPGRLAHEWMNQPRPELPVKRPDVSAP
ncbi:MAG: glycosyltransferase family 2 protein [Syntrophorhabdaceae bacterium]